MYNVSSSNLIPLCILRVLEEHSDEYHHLTQEEIARVLNLQYNMIVEGKVIGWRVGRLQPQLEQEIISEKTNPSDIPLHCTYNAGDFFL